MNCMTVSLKESGKICLMRIEKRAIGRPREGNQVKSRTARSKITTCKFYNELNLLKDIVTNSATTTNLAMPENDLNVTTPPVSQTFSLQQKMSSCYPVISQSSGEFLQSAAHNHELGTITPK